MKEDRIRVLQMLADKKITVEQAAAVLEELDKIRGPESENKAKSVRVMIFSIGVEKPKMNINIPLAWARMFSNFLPDSITEKIKDRGLDIDVKQIIEIISKGQPGKVAEIEDNTKNERIEISIE